MIDSKKPGSDSSATSLPPKKTYASKMKKKKESSADAPAAETQAGQDNTNERPKEKDVVKKRVPKKVEVDLPGPAPLSQTPVAKKPASKARKNGHSRGSSVVSVSAASTEGNDSTPSRMKPPSSGGPGKQESPHGGSLDDDASGDDSISIAGSVKSTRKRKGEPDRIQFFKDDPRCVEVEPHRALCVKCDTWVALHAKRRYVMQNWVTHRKLCAGTAKAPSPKASLSGSNEPPPLTEAESQGWAFLESDPRAGDVRPHEVFCNLCSKWIPLDPVSLYDTENWEEHAPYCQLGSQGLPFPSVVPASGTDVAAPTPATNIQSPPSEPHPVGMENDTLADRTAAAPEAPEASGSRKRGRDEEDEDEEEDVRVVRQRTNSYEPARGEGLWKTLTKPFRAFVDGFKQSLSTKPESG